jgi:hypothetical protein
LRRYVHADFLIRQRWMPIGVIITPESLIRDANIASNAHDPRMFSDESNLSPTP